jgi:hypothetical protein
MRTRLLAAGLAVTALGASRTPPPGDRASWPARLTLDTRVVVRAGRLTAWGGFGSAMAVHPHDPDLLYFLSDRGPNTNTGRENEKLFLQPSYAPRIGLFRRVGSRFRRVSEIPLRDEDGRPLTGLPNPPGEGGTGERAVDVAGRTLPPDPRGVDPEGLVALADGTFWVSEEYGPSLIHFDERGRTRERLTPYAASARGRRLPRVLAARRPNYGFEGLTITPDGRALLAILQSPLDNPSREVRDQALVTRLLWFDLATGVTRQHAYRHERPGLFNTAVAALSAEEVLILERDVLFAGHRERPARHKRIYRARLAEATDLTDPLDGPRGRLFGGRTPEQMSEQELQAAGVRLATRVLAADLLALPGGYPHDKPEGLVVLDAVRAAVCNDDDFGVSDEGGRLVTKTLPGAGGARDRNRVHVVPLSPGPG